MPENYITISGENGDVNISADVIASIAGSAIAEVEGIGGFSNTAVAELGELIGKKGSPKGVSVSCCDGVPQVSVTVMARAGANIASLAEKVQRAIYSAVESMTGLHSVVNVHVAGVIFEK